MRSLVSAKTAPESGEPQRGAAASGWAAALAGRLGLDLARCSMLGTSTGTELDLLLGPRPDESEEARLQRFLAACGIGETMFLRHLEQFSVLRRLISTLPSHGQGVPLSVWSAACSTGEEAYSLAAVLGPLAPLGVQVLGTDANRAAIACAERGRYRPWSLRGLHLHDAEVAGWLVAQGQELEVRDPVRSQVRFAPHNLVSDPYPTGCEVIFCRNALLYFQADVAAAVLRRFASSLRVGGLLFLGAVDPVPGDADLWLEEVHDGVSCFRRRDRHQAPIPVPTPGCASKPAALPPAPSAPPRPASQSAPGPLPEPAPPLLALARKLAAQRAFPDAIALLEKLCEESALAVQPHILLALVADEDGRPELALRAARRACFLSPSSPMAHYLMAQSLHRLGEIGQAARHREIALGQLDTLIPGQTVLPDGEGLLVSQLRRLLDGSV